MPILRGFSEEREAAKAVADLHRQIAQGPAATIIFFASPHYDRTELAVTLQDKFSGQTVIGCTTAGEITSEGYRENTLTGMSFSAVDFTINPVLIPDLKSYSMEDGEDIVRRGLSGLGLAIPTARSFPTQSFAMLLIDGMSKQEELVVSSLNSFLDPIPLFGGSAGDNLDFKITWVYLNGSFHTDAALLTLFNTVRPFKVFKLDHFTPTDQKMVVTEADPNTRLVMEINAEPAARAYAAMVGLEAQELSPMIFAAYPVVVKIGGEYHVRAIQKVEDDGSLRFYCGIDEGLVLTVAKGEDLASNLERNLKAVQQEIGQTDMILGFDCILRRLEAEQKQQTREVSDVLRRNKVIGFSTYGEQFRSMHVNQTFTGVAIGLPRAKPGAKAAE